MQIWQRNPLSHDHKRRRNLVAVLCGGVLSVEESMGICETLDYAEFVFESLPCAAKFLG